jgi:Ca2+-transporting ATPase
VNDAPALKVADIGVAMGLAGTDVAREAGDMVITDDNFASIVAAIEEGRVVFDNVRKATFYLLSCNLGELVAVLASLFLAFDLPFLPAQLLWINVVTDSVPAIALGFEPGERDTLRKPPRPREEPVISRRLWERTAVVGLWMAIGTLALFLYELSIHDDLDRARTVALTGMVLFQAFHVLNARSEFRSALTIDPRTNRLLVLGTLAAVGGHLLAMYLPPTQALLSIEPLDAATWARTVAVAASVIVAVEVHKRLRGSAPGSRLQAVSSSA